MAANPRLTNKTVAQKTAQYVSQVLMADSS
jgi:hypothetical protein